MSHPMGLSELHSAAEAQWSHCRVAVMTGRHWSLYTDTCVTHTTALLGRISQ